MKILHVYHIYPAIFGGVSRVVYDISRAQLKKGYKVSVLTTDFYYNHIDTTYIKNHNGIEVIRLPTIFKKIGKISNNPFPHPLSSSFIKTKIKFYDIIHLHGYRTLLNVTVAFYAKKSHIPIILQAHGSLPRVNNKKRLKWLYDVFFGYRLLGDVSKVIALTETEAKQYRAMGVPEKKIAIVPNGIDLNEYVNLPPKGSFKKKFGIPAGKKIILYLGRIHRTKGIDLLVEAYAYLTKYMRCKDTLLVIAGPDDGYLLELRRLVSTLGISDKVLFTGFLSHEEKLMAFTDAEVFVTPVFYGFPTTFLESCATGTPIITTTKGEKLEWINGKVGYVVSPTPSDLAQAIYRIISDVKLHRVFSMNCKNIVKTRFSINHIVNEIEKIYEKSLEER